jgi:hypothetical protein
MGWLLRVFYVLMQFEYKSPKFQLFEIFCHNNYFGYYSCLKLLSVNEMKKDENNLFLFFSILFLG